MFDQRKTEIRVGDFIVAATLAYRSANLRSGIVKKVSNTAVTIEHLELLRPEDGPGIRRSSSVSHTPNNCMVIPYPPTLDKELIAEYIYRQVELRGEDDD